MQAAKFGSLIIQRNALIGWLLLCILLVMSSGIILAALHLGVGMSPDSAIYIGVARNLAGGNGLTVPFGDQIDAPLAQFPPLYPIILALPGWAGIDPLAAAVPIQTGIFILNSILIYLIISQASKMNPWAPLAGVIVAVFSPSFLSIHQMAWSEGIFMMWVLLSMFTTAIYLKKPGMPILLVVAAFSAGLSAVTRYAGLAFVGALALGLFFLGQGSLTQRIIRGLFFGFLGILPLGLWLVQGLLSSGEATTRQLAFHPPGIEHIRTMINTMASWLLLSPGAPFLLKFAALIAVATLWIVVILKLTSSTAGFSFKKHPLLLLTTLSLLAYSGFILISLTFFDANIPLDDRILFPVFVCLQILIFELFGLFSQSSVRALWVAVGFLLLYVAITLPKNYQWAINLYNNGGGFNSHLLRSPEMVNLVSEQPQDLVIYSNSPEAAYFQTGRPALRLPRKIALMSQTSNENYEKELALVEQELRASSGIIIYYNWVKGKTTPDLDDLAQAMSLTYLMQDKIGAILAVQK